ncbi:MAG: beta-N-acetylhexosaminidase [Dysgonamonadaceae bacterium]|jgi:hexosaminidase|nr:beta-N-acetylhexosaminidase [Dysgonamonadaceae bacterium]
MKTLKQIIFLLIVLVQAQTMRGQTSEYNIVPKPLQAQLSDGQFTFNASTRLLLEKGVKPEAADAFSLLAGHLKTAAGIDLKTTQSKTSNAIICRLNKQLPSSESYRLQIEKNRIIVEANAPAGFFYASQTLRQLLPAAIESVTLQNDIQWTVPCGWIEDTPCYRYRGMHLDVCRHFSTKEEVMRYIDQLAFLKINTFHWHLTDDQGWRIEIKQYPRLTEVGGFRNRTVIGHYRDNPRQWNDTRTGGFYTQEDIREVVAYAQKRFINIVPEIELPGHAVAALAAYPEYSCSGGPFEVEGSWGVFNDVFCTRDETFDFLEGILTEVAGLFPYQYIHIGGDECPKVRWSRCHACQERIKADGLKDEHELQSYFVNRIGRFMETKGKKIIGWDEILEGGGLMSDAVVMSWRGTKGGIDAARQGHDVIMTPSNYLYLDFYQSKEPGEPIAIGGFTSVQTVYEYNPTPEELTPEEAKHIWGVQANVWTEYMPNPKHREYMIFPRIAALAEIAWLPREKKNYDDFKHRLSSLFQHYDVEDINYSKAIYKQ